MLKSAMTTLKRSQWTASFTVSCEEYDQSNRVFQETTLEIHLRGYPSFTYIMYDGMTVCCVYRSVFASMFSKGCNALMSLGCVVVST